MASKILDPNENYVKRFMKNQSKQIKMPSFRYIDAMFHPKFKDHCMILSSITNDFSSNINMTYFWDESIGNYYDFANNQKDQFEEAVKKVETEIKLYRNIVVQDSSIKSKEKQNDSKESNGDETPRSMNKTSNPLKTSNQAKLFDSDDSSYDYEGGEGDDEAKDDSDKFDDSSFSKTSSELRQEEEEKKGSFKEMESETVAALDSARPLEISQNAKKGSRKGDSKVEAIFEEDKMIDFGSKVKGGDSQKSDRNFDSAKDTQKDEQTVAPAENAEDNLSNFDHSHHEETKEANVVEECKVEKEDTRSAEEKFNDFTQQQKQRVVNLALDQVIKKKQHMFQFNYHGMEEELKDKNYTIPDSEQPTTSDDSYAQTAYGSWICKKKFFDIEYQPPIARERYQLSLWKIDEYGAVKVKDTYFTPKTPRASLKSFKGFRIEESLDKSTISLEEVDWTDSKKLVVILDPLTLEIISELEVKIKDLEIDDFQSDEYYDDLDNEKSTYATLSGAGCLKVFNKGENIIVGVGSKT